MNIIKTGDQVELYTWDELLAQDFEINEADGEEYLHDEMIFENCDISKEFFDMTDFSVDHVVVWVDDEYDFKIIKDHYTIPNEVIKQIIPKD